MSRPRKPSAHLELVGAFKKNPQRTRDSEPQCEEEAVTPPFPLSANAQTWWDFLLECAVPGVITKMDSSYLALCAESLATVWNDEATITDRRAVGVMLGKLGMTPSDRSSVIVAKKKKESAFSQFQRS